MIMKEEENTIVVKTYRKRSTESSRSYTSTYKQHGEVGVTSEGFEKKLGLTVLVMMKIKLGQEVSYESWIYIIQ